MATSGSVFSETLQEITNTKLDELSKRRSSFEDAKTSLLAATQSEENPVTRLVILSDGVKKCFAIKLDKTGKVMMGHTKHSRLETELKNLDRFLDQAKCDPSVSAKMLDDWQQSLLRHLDMQSLKFQYASLYGQLVTEWLSGDKGEEDGSADDVEMGDGFEDVGNAKKLESKMEWEKSVFEPANVNEAALQQYLDRLFGVDNEEKKAINTSLTKLRDAVYRFEAQISTPDQFTVSSLRWAIQGLHSSDLLSDEKREVLKDFESNNIILSEIADVLNMRISALSSWTWSSDAPVQVEMRRQINGVYQIHMHEDLLQAIFLQYIGVKWSVFFKGAFKNFRRIEGAWASARKDIPKLDKRRLGYYLGPLQASPCLQQARTKIYNHKYFMAQLMDHDQQDTQNVDGEQEAEYAEFAPKSAKRKAVHPMQAPVTRNRMMPRRQLASKAARKSAPSGDVLCDFDFDAFCEEEHDDDEESEEEEEKIRNPMALKQDLLHLLSTEITINTRLYGELTAFHSVFESWNARLPHETVCLILKFFGVSDHWLGFFRKFLEAPLKFHDDDQSVLARKRRRGTPGSHVISDFFGETTLFCLDFAINQSTSGSALWRIQDDVWFWSRDHAVAVNAWKTVEEFTAVTNTAVNPAKTGTVRVSNDSEVTLPIDKSLPSGEIRWGFLRLSPQTGRFEIDQIMVDAHIEELYKQLQDKRKSVFAFVQTWNTYAATFFTSNFGKAANCFGREHVDNMLATHERIQRQVFSKLTEEDEEKVSSVVEYLKKTISQRFGISNVPDGYLYFPMELGGLDLQSPFISLLQIRDEVQDVPSKLMDSFEEAERDAYTVAMKEFLEGNVKHQRYALDDPDWQPSSESDRQNFMPFNEYVQHREYFRFDHHPHGTRLHEFFDKLMQRPVEKSIDPDDSKVWTAHNQLGGQANLRGITSVWHNMEPYWRWVSMMYGPEIVDRFGGLNIVEPSLLPMGMVTMFRDKRVKWRG